LLPVYTVLYAAALQADLSNKAFHWAEIHQFHYFAFFQFFVFFCFFGDLSFDGKAV
jgi:hypothetical protein